MVGMFAVSKSPGPAVLMGAFLVFTILYHITMSKSLDPLMYSLPRTLQIEEELIQARQASGSDPEAEEATVSRDDSNGKSKLKNLHKSLVPGGGGATVQKKGNFFTKWLKPWIYADYATLRQLVPHEDAVLYENEYTDEIESNAFWPPSVTSSTPILWIPSDPAGVSKQEVALTSKVIPISDEGCSLDEKNKIQWDTEGARPPIWSEKIYY